MLFLIERDVIIHGNDVALTSSDIASYGPGRNVVERMMLMPETHVLPFEDK